MPCSWMRHANSNITMNIYTHAVSSKKRRAQTKVVEMILPEGNKAVAGPGSGGGSSRPGSSTWTAGWTSTTSAASSSCAPTTGRCSTSG